MTTASAAAPAPRPRTLSDRFLGTIEFVGNRLPDPAMLFALLMALVALASWFLSGLTYESIDPRTKQPLVVNDLLSGPMIAQFFANMVQTFTSFPPLGVVLVALLGIGIAEHAGFINAALKAALSITPRALLTPAIILVGLVSHTAADAGYVLVIPLAAALYHAAGRHPVAGICAAFAGVAGGFTANFIPSSIDPLIAGLSQAGAQIVDAGYQVNPLSNWFFNSASCLLVVLLGWFVTDRLVEPRTRPLAVDGEAATGGAADPGAPAGTSAGLGSLAPRERRGLWLAFGSIAAGLVVAAAFVAPEGSAMRAPDGSLTASAAPLMKSIVPLIFVLSLLPGVVYGYAAGTFKNHRDVVAGMSKAMGSMSYYLVLAFFAALFIAAFNQSNIGVLLALEGAGTLKALALPPQATIVGIVLLTNAINLLMASSSAKWALLAPVFVPMLMEVGISPELTQAAYRIADSTSNVVTPMNAYFPLVVVFCQKWVRSAGLGTLLSLMLPYWALLTVAWTLFLLGYWATGLPLGIQGGYVYQP